MTIPPEALALVGTGTKWLAGAGTPALAVWRLLGHDRTLLYALLPWLGKKVDARKMQETLVAESQKAYATELKSLAKQKDLQTQKFLKAKPAQRSLIQRDLEYIEGREREVKIKFDTLKDIAADTANLSDTQQAHPPKPISGCWMDQFDELVRRRNEAWRASLLKDALVREAQKPGSIAPRTLWLIGILEPEKFEVLSALLDIASVIGGYVLIPGNYVRFDRKIVPGLEKQKHTTGMAVVALSDTGLVENLGVNCPLEKGQSIIGSYDGKRIEVTSLGVDGRVEGTFFTGLGQAIAGLYKATPNALGREFFDRWVKELLPEQYSVKRL